MNPHEQRTRIFYIDGQLHWTTDCACGWKDIPTLGATLRAGGSLNWVRHRLDNGDSAA